MLFFLSPDALNLEERRPGEKEESHINRRESAESGYDRGLLHGLEDNRDEKRFPGGGKLLMADKPA